MNGNSVNTQSRHVVCIEWKYIMKVVDNLSLKKDE